MRHTVYVRTLVRLPSGEIRVQVMFTTTSPRMIARIPDGLSIRVSETSSRDMGMRNSFVVDIHRLALLPLDAKWFPEIGTERFVIGRADDKLKAAITKRYDEMRNRYPDPAFTFGPRG
jgi:hypothetical protein